MTEGYREEQKVPCECEEDREGNEYEKERTAKDASTRKRSSDGDGITKREGPVKRERGGVTSERERKSARRRGQDEEGL